MINYYQELDIPQELTGKELEAYLKKTRQKLILRTNAPDPEKALEAERKLKLLDEAISILCDKSKRAKYDKQLAKSGSSTEAAAARQPEQPQTQSTDASVEVLISVAEDMYNAGNLQNAINTCNKILANGVKDKRVYYVLAVSYYELNKTDEALKVLQNAVAENPDNFEMILYLARLSALIGRTNEAEKFINIVLEKQPDNTFAYASLVEVELIRGNNARAEQIIADINNRYPNDAVFKTNVSSAFERAAKRVVSVAKNGAGYLASKQDAEKYVTYVTKAHDLNPSEHMKNELDIAQGQFRKRFDVANWKGFACLLVACLLTLLSIGEMGTLPFIVCVLATIVLTYFNFKENWQIQRKIATGKNDPVDYIFILLGLALVIVAAIVKFAFNLAQESLKMKYES